MYVQPEPMFSTFEHLEMNCIVEAKRAHWRFGQKAELVPIRERSRYHEESENNDCTILGCHLCLRLHSC